MNKVIYQTYPHWYDKMQEFINENKNVKECDVCFVGDSIVEMADVSLLNKENKLYLNRGIVSDKTCGVLISLDDRVIATNPKKVFICIGSNDICDGYLLKEIENNYINIIERLNNNLNNINIIVSTVTPPCYYNAPHVENIYPDCRDINRIKALNEIIKSFENKFDNVKVIDSFSIIADENDSLRAKDTLDGVHLTKEAYIKIGKELIKLL